MVQGQNQIDFVNGKLKVVGIAISTKINLRINNLK